MDKRERIKTNAKYYCSIFNKILTVVCPSISSVLCLEIMVNNEYCNEILYDDAHVYWRKQGNVSDLTLDLQVWIVKQKQFSEIVKNVYQKNGKFIVFDMLLERVLDEIFELIKKNIDEDEISINYPKDAEELLNQSIKDFMVFSEFPDLRGINYISSMAYESDQCIGRIVFLNDVCFEENDAIEFEKKIEFSETNYRIIRKILQIAGQEKYVVFDRKQFKITGLVSKEGSSIANEDNFVLEFKGHMHWVLYHHDMSVIQFIDGVYHIIDDETYREQIEQYCINNSVKKEQIEKLIENVSKQKHGTLVIISSNAEKEAKRLSENNRGIKIKPINLIENETWICSITSIDGALMMDKDFNCYSIGTLLDGPSVRGDISRGARYNSALSYVSWRKEEKENVIAIVISEDKMINVIY